MTDWQGNMLWIWLQSVGLGLVPVLLLSFVLQSTRRAETAVVLGATALVGASAGLTGGLSREPAVGLIIPAYLGLFSGVVMYLFGVDRSRGLIGSFAAASLSIALLVSYLLGAESRLTTDELHNARTLCAKAFSDAELLSDAAAYKIFSDRYGLVCYHSRVWKLPDDDES